VEATAAVVDEMTEEEVAVVVEVRVDGVCNLGCDGKRVVWMTEGLLCRWKVLQVQQIRTFCSGVL